MKPVVPTFVICFCTFMVGFFWNDVVRALKSLGESNQSATTISNPLCGQSTTRLATRPASQPMAEYVVLTTSDQLMLEIAAKEIGRALKLRAAVLAEISRLGDKPDELAVAQRFLGNVESYIKATYKSLDIQDDHERTVAEIEAWLKTVSGP